MTHKLLVYSSDQPSSLLIVKSSTKSFSKLSVFVAFGHMPDFGAQIVRSSVLNIPRDHAIFEFLPHIVFMLLCC